MVELSRITLLEGTTRIILGKLPDAGVKALLTATASAVEKRGGGSFTIAITQGDAPVVEKTTRLGNENPATASISIMIPIELGENDLSYGVAISTSEDTDLKSGETVVALFQ